MIAVVGWIFEDEEVRRLSHAFLSTCEFRAGIGAQRKWTPANCRISGRGVKLADGH